ncbi:MAG: NAD(P)/FAD-dependent oxidoreductase [Anaerolineales bacterium]|nr:MAG: NAD(P)/FAD-dependent oxidoreductase [Anaerolineales bacterium]
MAHVLVVGDGPGGLSAALFLAKKGMQVTVFGKDKTDMHRAMLHNYLGIPEIRGSEFQQIARQQVRSFGASLQDLGVTGIEKTSEGFMVTSEDGGQHQGAYLILAEGKRLELAKSLDLPRTANGVEVDDKGRTAVEGLYVVGRGRGIARSQAIISAGQGATAALDILSREAGRDVKDYDSVSD